MQLQSPSLKALLVRTVAFCAVLAVSWPVYGEEDGLALLLQAARHAGDREIQSGEFTYTQHVITDPPAPERIKQAVERSRAAIRRSMDAAGGNETRREALRKALDEVEESITSQMKRNADREWQYHFVLRVKNGQAERYAEFSPIDTKPDQEEHTQIALLRQGLTVLRHHRTSTHITSTGVYFGQEPQRLGRLTGLLVERLAGKDEEMVRTLRDTVTSIEVEKLDNDQDSTTRKLTCHFEGAGALPTQILIHVDPLRGFVTPLVRESDEERNVLREWIASDYFQPEGSEQWFPRSATYREFAKLFGQNRTEHYEFATDGVALNKPLPDDRFTILLKKNSTLLDDRNQANISYKVKDECRLSLDAISDLGKLPSLERR